MTQPQVESETTVVAPANGGSRNRTAEEASQPAKLDRPLEESARIANQQKLVDDGLSLYGTDYNVTAANGFRKA